VAYFFGPPCVYFDTYTKLNKMKIQQEGWTSKLLSLGMRVHSPECHDWWSSSFHKQILSMQNISAVQKTSSTSTRHSLPSGHLQSHAGHHCSMMVLMMHYKLCGQGL